MADIINLRLARKAKARTESEKTAEQNRAKFGQTKAEKTARKLEEARAKKVHEAGKISPDAQDCAKVTDEPGGCKT
jgi:Domain of unknown function (DUF4169)